MNWRHGCKWYGLLTTGVHLWRRQSKVSCLLDIDALVDRTYLQIPDRGTGRSSRAVVSCEWFDLGAGDRCWPSSLRSEAWLKRGEWQAGRSLDEIVSCGSVMLPACSFDFCLWKESRLSSVVCRSRQGRCALRVSSIVVVVLLLLMLQTSSAAYALSVAVSHWQAAASPPLWCYRLSEEEGWLPLARTEIAFQTRRWRSGVVTAAVP